MAASTNQVAGRNAQIVPKSIIIIVVVKNTATLYIRRSISLWHSYGSCSPRSFSHSLSLFPFTPLASTETKKLIMQTPRKLRTVPCASVDQLGLRVRHGPVRGILPWPVRLAGHVPPSLQRPGVHPSTRTVQFDGVAARDRIERDFVGRRSTVVIQLKLVQCRRCRRSPRGRPRRCQGGVPGRRRRRGVVLSRRR